MHQVQKGPFSKDQILQGSSLLTFWVPIYFSGSLFSVFSCEECKFTQSIVWKFLPPRLLNGQIWWTNPSGSILKSDHCSASLPHLQGCKICGILDPQALLIFPGTFFKDEKCLVNFVVVLEVNWKCFSSSARTQSDQSDQIKIWGINKVIESLNKYHNRVLSMLSMKTPGVTWWKPQQGLQQPSQHTL